MKRTSLLILFSFLTITFLSAQCQSGDCQNGTGVFLYQSGAKYIGEFVNGEIHGIGACYYTDGRKYQGQWSHRFPEGEGTMIFTDGSKWTGLWKRGHPVNEKGEIVEELFVKKNIEDDGTNIQSGCIEGDCENGRGIFAYPDGSKYDGQFTASKPDGWGTFFYGAGEKYIGSFQNGFAHGQGTFYHADDSQTTGNWEQGEFVGNPVIENGRSGCISGNCKNGRGTYIYREGSAKYVGQFKNDLPDGKGAVYYSNGERYVGDWSKGSFEGLGTLYLSDGTAVAGRWEEGTFMGKSEEAMPEEVLVDTDSIEENNVADNESELLNSNASAKDTDPVLDQLEAENIESEDALVEAVSQETKIDSIEFAKQKIAAEEVEHIEVNEEAIEDVFVRPTTNIKVWALVVGVSSYDHMPTLRYTDDDAYRMFAHLKSPEGGALSDDHIRILIDEDATKSNIENTMRELFGQADEDDLVLLYFSGHGLRGSFLPIDYDGYNNKIKHEEINAILKESPAKYKLCIADACHSGSLLAMKSGTVKNALESYYNTLAQAEAGTALIMSSKSDETSLESSGLRQGVFSHFLIRGLKGEADSDDNKLVTIKELYDFIFENVRTYTGNRQSPLIKGDYDEKMTVAVRR